MEGGEGREERGGRRGEGGEGREERGGRRGEGEKGREEREKVEGVKSQLSRSH